MIVTHTHTHTSRGEDQRYNAVEDKEQESTKPRHKYRRGLGFMTRLLISYNLTIVLLRPAGPPSITLFF